MQSTLEKNSPTLNRTAVYTQTSKITRLPAYLTVHMVRFAWRADVGRKAKIMVRITPLSNTFPFCHLMLSVGNAAHIFLYSCSAKSNSPQPMTLSTLSPPNSKKRSSPSHGAYKRSSKSATSDAKCASAAKPPSPQPSELSNDLGLRQLPATILRWADQPMKASAGLSGTHRQISLWPREPTLSWRLGRRVKTK